ncbi:MAG TPA: hypothetical protein VGP07_19225 [Polyangia bacterium]
MQLRVAAGVAALLVAGCGGGSSSTGTGGHGSGVGGSGGQVGGASGVGGASATGGASGGVPACAVTTKPQDPGTGVCNSITITGATVVPESVVGTSTGIVLDGGAFETPMGGTIADGDFDLVRWQDDITGSTRRTIRVFGGGTYIEWAGVDLAYFADGGELDFRYDTTEHVNGSSLVADSTDCTDGPAGDDFTFTATGEELILFNTIGGTGSVSAVDTYRRTCARP